MPSQTLLIELKSIKDELQMTIEENNINKKKFEVDLVEQINRIKEENNKEILKINEDHFKIMKEKEEKFLQES